MTDPEKSAREFLALLPDGCEPSENEGNRCSHLIEFECGSSYLGIVLSQLDTSEPMISADWSLRDNADHGSFFDSWANEIPAPLMERIKEFKR